MAVGESDTILFGDAAGVDPDEAAPAELPIEDAALPDGAEDDGADDDALLDGADTAAVDTAGVVDILDIADGTVEPATGEVLAATDGEVAATPL